MKSIQDLVEQDKSKELKAINQYNIQNAWLMLILEDVHMEYSVLHAL